MIKETDDDIDVSSGLDKTMPGVVTGTPREETAVLWQLGGGNDRVVGAQNQTNWFQFGTGQKTLTGGHQNDSFGLTAAAELLMSARSELEPGSALHGGAGIDTISLLGKAGKREPAYAGYDIDLKEGRLGLRRDSANGDVMPLMTLTSIENVETLAGASSRVTGSDDANEITVGGNDFVDSGGGDDTIHIAGLGIVHGGAGADRYIIDEGRGSGTVSIGEDGRDRSDIVLRWDLENIEEWRIEGSDLLVYSRHGDDDSPGREIRITGVYREENGARVLKNDKLFFHTEDGYTVTPDLPSEWHGDHASSVKAVIHVQGKAKPAPEILDSGVHAVSSQRGALFVGRSAEPVTLEVKTDDPDASSTIYLDYDANEIADVEYRYEVESSQGASFNHLKYRAADLVLKLKDGKDLTLKNVASNRSEKGTNVGGNLIASGFELNHSFVMTLHDGTSYRVSTPQHSYFDDHGYPGAKTVDGKPSLKLRPGKYMFNNPNKLNDLTVHKVTMDEPRVDIPAWSTYELQGKATTHEVFLMEGAIIKLSTPGAEMGQSNASIWNLHVDALGDVDSDRDMTLEDGRLLIKNIVVQFPPVDDTDKPLEAINIVTRAGTYRVDRIAEVIVLEEKIGI
ncbi:calcium-binding protein [Burkholderia ambifaria]|uniref:calcium-binding protein n=1 Tax=Burkholderia ambifaria TaxID=152480 RepID=UPI0005571B02|nr:calcium-binding protein [Burkholderia ambifaria]